MSRVKASSVDRFEAPSHLVKCKKEKDEGLVV